MEARRDDEASPDGQALIGNEERSRLSFCSLGTGFTSQAVAKGESRTVDSVPA